MLVLCGQSLAVNKTSRTANMWISSLNIVGGVLLIRCFAAPIDRNSSQTGLYADCLRLSIIGFHLPRLVNCVSTSKRTSGAKSWGESRTKYDFIEAGTFMCCDVDTSASHLEQRMTAARILIHSISYQKVV